MSIEQPSKTTNRTKTLSQQKQDSKKSTTKKSTKPSATSATRSTSRGVDSAKNPSHLTAYQPSTGEKLGLVECINVEHMPEIIQEAKNAQKIWSSYSFEKRAKHILAIRDYIIDHSESIAKIISMNTGKTFSDALQTEVLPTIIGIDWYAKKSKKHLAKKRINPANVLFANKFTYLTRIPLGVVGIVSPWNYPFTIPFGDIIMGLMAGNAVLYRPAEETPLVAQEIEKIIKVADLPQGLCRMTLGRGPEISTAWLQHGIDKLFFTGSVQVGKLLMKQAAETLTPVSLELGGNDPMIVLEDANLERAANGAIWAGFQNSGQSCAAVERVYVHESVASEFLVLLKEKTLQLRQGIDRGNFDTDVGSMILERQLNTVKQHVDQAIEKGATIFAQGKIRDAEGKNFYPATVLTNVNHDMPVMNQETFGPVMGVMTFSTDQEAIRLANDSDFGLTSSVWTMNHKRGKRIAEQLETGITTINDHLFSHGMSELPWLGWKNSGMGVTHSHLGLEEMTQIKAVNYDIAPQVNANVWWFPTRKIKTESLIEAPHVLFGKTFKNKLESLQSLIPRLTKDPLLREKAFYAADYLQEKGIKKLQKTVQKIRKRGSAS